MRHVVTKNPRECIIVAWGQPSISIGKNRVRITTHPPALIIGDVAGRPLSASALYIRNGWNQCLLERKHLRIHSSMPSMTMGGFDLIITIGHITSLSVNLNQNLKTKVPGTADKKTYFIVMRRVPR